jgi:hypothetical protein
VTTYLVSPPCFALSHLVCHGNTILNVGYSEHLPVWLVRIKYRGVDIMCISQPHFLTKQSSYVPLRNLRGGKE